MYSSSNFERLFIRYKAEVMPEGESLQSFCSRNKVPYNLFHKWYKDTRHQIVPVHVEGHPEAESDSPTEVSSSPVPERKADTASVPVKNNDRYPYDERHAYTATQLDLPGFEKSDSKTGGLMPNN